MTRYVIIGAGAVGASLAAQLELSGIEYLLVGRGAQIDQIRQHGLSYQRPSGTRQIRLNAFDQNDPPELKPTDILVLTVKSQDAASALASWSWRSVSGSPLTAAEGLPIVTFQNGLATEAAALRTFTRVYGASILTAARFTETGKVVVGGDPEIGIVTVGRFPAGRDEIANRIAEDLNRAGYLAEPTTDIRRWKSAKLLQNVRNVLELFDGPSDLRADIGDALVEEARRTLNAAGYKLASPSERTVDVSNWRTAQDSGIHPGQQSTWQSFTRGASSEVDFLNGEIALLGRIHGHPTPYNDAAQALAGKLAQEQTFSSLLPLDAILSLVDNSNDARQTGLAATH